MTKDKNPSWQRWIKKIPLSFCKGCLYGAILNNLARALEELGKDPAEVVAVSGIGCAGGITDRYFMTDTLYSTHGRPIVFATGTKLARPDLAVIVVSGDGDLTSIGTNHLIHAARRNIDLTVFCANNFLYGMTGGQTGSTTPRGIITSTAPQGNTGQPLDAIKLALTAGCSHASRYSIMPLNGKASLIEEIKDAITYPGFSFFEFICPCKTHFSRRNKMPTPKEVKDYLKDLLLTKDQAACLNPQEKQGKLTCGTFGSLTEYTKLVED